MAYPRTMTVAPDEAGFYHCISRCLRRAWLCGDDPLSGRNFDHRRAWIEARLIHLAGSFAVGLYAWAVMSNHTHVVLRIDPQRPLEWSDAEVAARWARLERTLDEEIDSARIRMRERTLLQQPERLAEIRERLGSLSWFMRFLNEAIARAANAEDRCTGRFWEGRFKCQALLDEAAVLACMAYVDLNPIRAGLCDTLVNSDFTTIQRRLRALDPDDGDAAAPLRPVAGDDLDAGGPGLSERAYVDLVGWTGRIARPDKRGVLSGPPPAEAESIRGSPDWWARSALGVEAAFGTAVGSPLHLKAHAKATGRAWLRGMSL
jgi:REP element-mobilizing transposase RayT